MTRNQDLNVLHVDDANQWAAPLDARVVSGDTLIFDFVYFLHPVSMACVLQGTISLDFVRVLAPVSCYCISHTHVLLQCTVPHTWVVSCARDSCMHNCTLSTIRQLCITCNCKAKLPENNVKHFAHSDEAQLLQCTTSSKTVTFSRYTSMLPQVIALFADSYWPLVRNDVPAV